MKMSGEKYCPVFIILVILVFPILSFSQSGYSSFVDPFIGTAGNGDVVIGPSCPFGIIKPGPDYSLSSNSGYRPETNLPLMGFSQVHVSGRGGSAKYGNISIMPFIDNGDKADQTSLRLNEEASLGYYGVTTKNGNIRAEVTTGRIQWRCADR